MLPPLSVLSRAPALSIKQPWAELILRGRKQIEVRSWSTAYRGFVWLHTGRSRDTAAVLQPREPPTRRACRRHGFDGCHTLRSGPVAEVAAKSPIAGYVARWAVRLDDYESSALEATGICRGATGAFRCLTAYSRTEFVIAAADRRV